MTDLQSNKHFFIPKKLLTHTIKYVQNLKTLKETKINKSEFEFDKYFKDQFLNLYKLCFRYIDKYKKIIYFQN